MRFETLASSSLEQVSLTPTVLSYVEVIRPSLQFKSKQLLACRCPANAMDLGDDVTV